MIRALLVLVVLASGRAAAEPAQLAAARRAVREVRYDEARGLLVQALRAGGNGPDELREIYRLSAFASIVLGEPALGERYYRRMLALDPRATLSGDTAPKLRAPFVAAQAFMAAQRPLAIRALRRDDRIEVAVSDPLGMAAGVAALVGGAVTARQPLAADHARLPADGGFDEIALVDEFGNVLRTIDVPAAPVVAPGPTRPERPVPAGRRSWATRWTTWAVPAAVLAAAGVGFAIAADRAHTELDDILANDDEHFFAEADAARARWQRDSWIAWASFGVAGACAITATVLAFRAPPRRPVAAAIGPGGVTVFGHF